MPNEELKRFTETLEKCARSGTLKNVVFHTPESKEFLKAKGTLKMLKGQNHLQIESFLSEGRVTQKNLLPEDIDREIPELIKYFRRAEINDSSGTLSLLSSKKGKITLIKKGSPGEARQPEASAEGNDRKKNRLLTGEEKFLSELGISDVSGRIHDKKQSKFRQICRFSEYIVEAEKKLPGDIKLVVYDLCCGKSYLSFAAYHVLTEICGRQVEMTGIDLKQSVIDYCNDIAEKSGMKGLHFECSDINRVVPDKRPNLVLSLHACDIATDLVLDFAVRYGADMILSTPCCHHHLAKNLSCPSVDFISKNSILSQKFCDAATDSLRLLKLEAEGYSTDATELIDPEDTPKNVMLRAQRRPHYDFRSKTAAERAEKYLSTFYFLYGKYPDEKYYKLIKTDNTRGKDYSMEELLNKISRTDIPAEERLEALRELKKLIDAGKIEKPAKTKFVNNHIHTCYSFSPYTPTSAVFYAWKAGLGTAGIMDHDSVAGFREFIEAGKIMNMPITCGFECRTNVKGTPLFGKKLNNPDQDSCAYLAMHGIPHQSIDKAEKVLCSLREKRNERNRLMCANINNITRDFGIEIDFDADVYPLSMAREGGSVTERHICFALTKKITERYPDRNDAADFIEKICGTPMSPKTREKLLTAPDNFYEFDILGVLKGHMVEKFYVDATDECMNIKDFTALAKELGAISAYAYLGDVGESPTGDKKAQKFEDDFLDELFDCLEDCGFSAVTYMPSRNTKEQLIRVMDLCEKKGLFQISGEDINSPRQSFICKAMDDPLYSHLRKATYALIGHEMAASKNIEDSMFSEKTLSVLPDLGERIAKYSAIGGFEE